jgi:hypothetical protein
MTNPTDIEKGARAVGRKTGLPWDRCVDVAQAVLDATEGERSEREAACAHPDYWFFVREFDEVGEYAEGAAPKKSSLCPR